MPTNAEPTIGVVTVTYNSGPVLEDFLDSLAAQKGVRVRLYSIDNASGDDSVATVRAESRLDRVEVVANPDNRGVAVGNNQGIEAALRDGCDWVLLLNNDTVFDPTMMQTLVLDAEQHRLDLVAPVIEASEPAGTIWYAGGRTRGLSMVTRHLDVGASIDEAPTELAPTGYASTCCLLVRPAVFERVGLMDPVYFVYFDDVDFAIRAKRAGYTFWLDPRARLLHKASSLTGGKLSPFTVRWTARNWPLVVRRHRSGAPLALALAYVQLWTLGRLVVRRDSLRDFILRQQRFLEAMRVPLVAPPRASR